MVSAILSRILGRAPHGARGLKSAVAGLVEPAHLSRPAWGAWIEIADDPVKALDEAGRAPHGARGLKSVLRKVRLLVSRRAPHGARGLKYLAYAGKQSYARSRPAWGAWIEIISGWTSDRLGESRAPHGARGLKYGQQP